MPPGRAVGCLEQNSSSIASPSSSRRLDLDPINTVELEKRFQDLSAVLQKARDSFSCRLEEDQTNPLKELRTRLLKAKERFHSRLANSSRFPDPGGFYPVERENPFQELRSVLRCARINFVPVLDQYILDNRSNARRSSSNADDQSLEQKSTSTRTESKATRPFEEDRVPDLEPPGSSNENNIGDYSHDESPIALHEETRFRRSSKILKAPAAVPKHEPQLQPQEEALGMKSPLLPAPPAHSSSAQRLDVLINEELERKRGYGATFQHFHSRSTGTNPR